ncbi:hypothetical protein ElyMa_001750500 [Elysia marginata]|uniref:Tc1-like transposase DDE domain-containing protein n=1 Tax=Elysia marginata TaxID=1093978 RepID=A0AAV4EAD1_9GAST|nr:hypothetical protein ElyMa_001750500 [Elysia marginata]
MRLGYIPEILKQSDSQPNGETLMSLVERKFDANKGLLRSCALIFFDMNGVILRWPVPTQSMHSTTRRCCKTNSHQSAIRKKRPGLLESGILFHHDNAPAHMARAVTDVLAGYK